MISKPSLFVAIVMLSALRSDGALAQGKEKALVEYLQKETVTLYDVGMKSLRRLALDTAANMVTKPEWEASSSVSYKPTVGNIEIVFDVKIADAGGLDDLRQQCVEVRKSTILKMFRIGLTNYATPLSVNERILNRIGGQFAHEPMGSMQETQSLGARLGPLTYFTLKLTTTSEPAVSVTCRGLVTDSMTVNKTTP